MSKMPAAATAAEILIGVMAREIRPGDMVVQGIATPLVLCAFMLAKATHAPDLQFLFTSGCTVSERPGPVRLAWMEVLTVQGCLRALSSPTFHGEVAASMRTKEFLRPAQVDGRGNTNNVAIGDYGRPKVRLPGAVGIADVTTFNPNLYLYVPRHDRRTLVERVDFVSGTGTHVRALITDLCVFGFTPEGPHLLSLRPGVSLETVRGATGFAFRAAGPAPAMPLPTPAELELIREDIDPLGTRELEMNTGPERLDLLRRIAAAESVMSYGT